MKNLISPVDRILEIASYLHWWTYFDLNFWFSGDPEKRVWFVENEVSKMHKARLLKRVKLGKRYYYSSWSQPSHLEHGIICTRALLRFWAAKKDCKFVSENEFREQKFGVVPEWAVLYPTKTMLLFEYCTADNAGRNGLVKKKVNLYSKSLPSIEKHFKAKAAVLVVLDTKTALDYAMENVDASFAYFVELQRFLSVPASRQLSAPIYIWAQDGKEYQLSHD